MVNSILKHSTDFRTLCEHTYDEVMDGIRQYAIQEELEKKNYLPYTFAQLELFLARDLTVADIPEDVTKYFIPTHCFHKCDRYDMGIT
jgi:hypothetical protein